MNIELIRNRKGLHKVLLNWTRINYCQYLLYRLKLTDIVKVVDDEKT